MPDVLLSWIGKTHDLDSPVVAAFAGGPILAALRSRAFDHVVLLNDHDPVKVERYLSWLRGEPRSVTVPITVRPEPVSDVMDFGEVFPAAVRACDAVREEFGPDVVMTFHGSPGTPVMQAVWIILAKTRFPATVIHGSPERGIRTAVIPFDISADFIPDLRRTVDARIEQAAEGRPRADAGFGDVYYRSKEMAEVVRMARTVARRTVSVLLEGESGTGKELLARAIHDGSSRKGGPLVAVNCGALPRELVESELFGHEKGAFTNAYRQKKGCFEVASGGTLFLDEVGELPLDAQVKLLRALQEKRIKRVGAPDDETIAVDARVVAATNRTLTTEVAAGRFREDLFYRLAVAVIRVPPLRARQGDVSLLIDKLFEQVSDESESKERKVLSAGARNRLLQHPWPGNIRELQNTLQRAVLWTEGRVIEKGDIERALLPIERVGSDNVLGEPLGSGFDLRQKMGVVAKHYLERAMMDANDVKAHAAKLVGLGNATTLTKWLERYGVES